MTDDDKQKLRQLSSADADIATLPTRVLRAVVNELDVAREEAIITRDLMSENAALRAYRTRVQQLCLHTTTMPQNGEAMCVICEKRWPSIEQWKREQRPGGQ